MPSIAVVCETRSVEVFSLDVVHREWTDRRHFDVYERTVQMDGSMSEPEIVVEYADSNSAMKRAFFRDDD